MQQNKTTILAAALLFAGLLIFVGVPASSQTPVAVSVDYKVKIGDVLSISVLNHPEFSIAGSRIQNDGTISYFFGPIVASDKTLQELNKAVRKAIVDAKQLVNPIVVVSVSAREPNSVNVYGDVRGGGKVELKDNSHLLDILALVGGLPSDRYDFFKITIYRTAGSKSVNVSKLYSGDVTENLLLESGDNIIVDELDPNLTTVRVVGEVRSQISIVFPKDGSILAVINAAGGVTPAAALSQASIMRDGQTIEIDLRGLTQTGKVPSGAVLKAGDILVIPTNKRVIRVNGATQRTGELPYPDDKTLTLFQGLSLAGLPVQNADLKAVRLTRRNVNGVSVTTVHDIEQMLKGNVSKDVVLLPDDMIYVAPKMPKRRIGLQEVFLAITTLTSVLRLIK